MALASNTGLVSGLNYSDIISKMRAANSSPLYQIQAKSQKMQAQQQAMNGIKTLLEAFSTRVDGLSSPDTFRKVSATSSDTAVLMASASSSAPTGSYSARVRQLAQAARVASQGFANTDTASISDAGGSLKFSIGEGEVVSVDVTSGMNLRDLTDAINAEKAGVRASIVSDGTASTPYRLVLTSEKTGAANAINIIQNDTLLRLDETTVEAAAAGKNNVFDGTVTSGGTYTGSATRNAIIEITTAGAVGAAKYKVSTDGGLTWTAADSFTTSTDPVDITGAAAEGITASFTAGTADLAAGDRFTIDAFAPVLQQAQDAILEVDGIQVSRDSNEFTDIIEGVTLTARKVDEKAVSVNVTSQKSTISGQIKELVDTYNALVGEIATQTAYDVKNEKAAVLFGDSSVNSIVSRLRSSLTRPVEGNGAYSTLSSIGITFDSKGKLQADLTKVNKALDADSDAVMRLFVQAGQSSSSSIQLQTAGDTVKVGQYGVEITTPASQATVTGSGVIGSGGLTAEETLSFEFDDRSFNVTLSAGSTLSQIVAKLNTQFGEKNFELKASEDGGRLRVTTVEYGSEFAFAMKSTRDAAAPGQLGIGTTLVDATGVDVAGRIGAMLATGKGQVLKAGANSPAAGLELLVTSTTPVTSNFTLSRGIADMISREIDAITHTDTGIFAARTKTVETRTKAYEEQYARIQERLDRDEAALKLKFTQLEIKLSAMQSQSTSLQNMLSSLI